MRCTANRIKIHLVHPQIIEVDQGRSGRAQCVGVVVGQGCANVSHYFHLQIVIPCSRQVSRDEIKRHGIGNTRGTPTAVIGHIVWRYQSSLIAIWITAITQHWIHMEETKPIEAIITIWYSRPGSVGEIVERYEYLLRPTGHGTACQSKSQNNRPEEGNTATDKAAVQ